MRLLLVVLIGLVACGGVGPGSRMIGGQCTLDADCAKRCVRDGHHPAGMCSQSCNSEKDCPGGSTCVSDDGGICEPICTQVAECTLYSAGYSCDVVDRHGSPGQALTCRVP